MTNGASHAEFPSAKSSDELTSSTLEDLSGPRTVDPNRHEPGGRAQINAFDRLTRLAVRLLRVPIALVSAPEGEGETVVSHVGLPEPWASRRRNPVFEPERWQTIGQGGIIASANGPAWRGERDEQGASQFDAGAYLAAPLIASQSQVVGYLCVIDTQLRVWTDDEIDSLKDLVASVVMEIELRTVIEEQQRDKQAQQFLDELADYMRNQDDPDELLWTIVQRVGAFLDVSRCLFSEIDFQNDRITVLRDYHHDLPSFQGVYSASSFSAAGADSVSQGRTVIVEDTQADERTAAYYAMRYGPGGARAYVSIPLMRDGMCVSTFWVSDQQPRHWSPRELALLHNVGERAWLTAEKLRAEADRRASEAAYRGIFEVSDVGIAMTELETGRFLYVNPKLCAITGRSPEEMTALTFREITHPDDLPANWALYQQLTRGELPRFSLEKRYRCKNGAFIHVHVDVALMRDIQGRARHAVAIIQDITERKRIEDALTTSESNYRALNEAIPAIIFSTTPDGRCDYINQQWLKYTGLMPSAALGDGWLTALHPDDQAPTLRGWQQSIRDGVVFEAEYRFRSPDGEYHWFLGRAAPLRDTQGHIVRWLGVATNIHDRKLAEETHRFVNHLYEETRDIDDAEEITALVARALGRRLNLNRATFSDVDLDHDQVIVYRDFHRDVPSISGIHPISDYSTQTTQDMLAGRTVVVHDAATDPRTQSVYEQTYRPLGIGAYVDVPLLRHGRWSYTLSVSTKTSRSWSDAEVRLIEAVAIRTWLIVERRRTEKALRESEAILRSYYTSAPVNMGLVELTDDGDILHLYDNPTTCRFFGLPEGGTAGRRASEMGASSATISQWRWHYLASQEQGQVVEFEYEHILPNGRQWLSVAVSPVTSSESLAPRFCYVAQDITGRKRAEIALRESEQRLRLALDAGQMGVWEWDGRTGQAVIDQRVHELLALPALVEGPLDVPILAAIHPEDRPAVQDALRQSVVDVSLYRGEYRIIRPDGSIRWMASTGQPLVDSTGQVTHLVGVVYDITPRKQVEEALRLSEQHLRNVIDGLFAFVGVMTTDGILIEANRTALQAASLTPEDVLGKPFEQTYWWAWSPDVQAQLRTAIQRAAQGERTRYDVVVRLADDHFVTIDFMLAPLFNEQGQVTYLVPSAIDITDRKQTEVLLRESRELAARRLAELEATYNYAPVGLCVLDRDLRWVRINERLAEINGFAVADHLGRNLAELLPDLAPKVEPTMRAILETGEPVINIEVVGETPAHPGVERTWIESWLPLYDTQSSIIGLNIVAQEVTAQKRAEAALRESRERATRNLAELEATYQSAPVGLCVFDRDLRWVRINQVLADINGHSVEAHLGRRIRDISAPLAERIEPILERIMETGQPVVNMELSGPKTAEPNAIRTVLGSWFPMYAEDGEITGINAVVQDITDRKRAEAERERLLLGEKAAREEAEAANRAKDEFLAVASHELRTPLTAILGWASALRSGRLKTDTAARAIQVIEQNAQVQAQLIEDILDFSRIITGKLNFKTDLVDLNTVVQAAIDSVRLAAAAKDIHLHPRLLVGAAPVLGDSDRLQQVAWNLLTNAVKFTPQGGQMFIELTTSDSMAQLTVRDTGIGIPADFLPYVFDRFRQADSSSTRKYGGLGLGLAIVRYIVEAHGGTVHATSPGPDQGATFTVRLPLETEEPGETSDGAAGHRAAWSETPTDQSNCPPALAGQRVLVVEDEVHTRELICMLLEGCGADVRSCSSVREALALVAEWWPSILISDIGMPEEDGYSLIRKLRALQAKQQRELTALALTAYARSQDRQRAIAAGYDLFLAKPIDPDDLLQRLAELIPT